MKNSVCLLFFLLFSILLMSCSSDDRTGTEEGDIGFPSPLFDECFYISHRGLDGYPENTYIAIEAAIKAGYRAVECDIQITKDGIPVLSHDKTIDRCSNGVGKISDMNYQELLKYDFGGWYDKKYSGESIPTLDIISKLCKSYGVILELDLAGKGSVGLFSAIYEVVKNNGALSSTMFTAKKDQLDDFLDNNYRDICISISGIKNLNEAIESLYLRDMVMYANYSISSDLVNKEICDYAHENRMKVKTWTTDDISSARMQFGMGVDYIITNTIRP